MSKRVLVTIPESRFVPTIGKGPINRPISITIEQYNMLVSLGYKIEKAGQKVEKIEPVAVEGVEAPVQAEPVVDESAEEETVEEDVEESTEEDTVEVEEQPEEEAEEVVEEVEEEEVDADVAYTEEDLAEATKKELQEILTKRGVQYAYKDTVPVLKEAVLSSNPA
jgi:hypothetical protein